MFNFLSRKYHYFIICKTESSNEKGKLINPKIYKFVKSYFFWRGRSVKYFEPVISKDTQETFAVFGTAKGERTVNRNCLIFLLELYSATKDTQFIISDDFPKSIKTFGEQEIAIYKIEK